MDWLPRTKWPLDPAGKRIVAREPLPERGLLRACSVLAYLCSKAVEICARFYRFFLSFTEQSIACPNYLLPTRESWF